MGSILRTLFMGTSDFAVHSLEALIASPHEVVAVVTQPDRPKGRGRGVQISPVKEVALAHGIPVLQPEKLRTPQAISEIKSVGDIDAIVVAAYGQIVPADLLYWPKHGSINVHGSILPKYRGAAPIQYAIMMGETQTGVTTMLMDVGLDTGDILLQESLDIGPNETYGELTPRLARMGADLLVRTLDGIEDGTIVAIPQDNDLATEARSLARDAGVIDWTRQSSDIVNRIRGCTPRPGAFTGYAGSRVKVWSAAVSDLDGEHGKPGEVICVDENGIVIAAGTGSVRLIEVQPESRKRMAACDFARGSRIEPGAMFDVRYNMA